MKNEEKAEELSWECHGEMNYYFNNDKYQVSLVMAEWKDKQLDEAIESCKNAVGSCEVESIDEALEYIKNYIK